MKEGYRMLYYDGYNDRLVTTEQLKEEFVENNYDGTFEDMIEELTDMGGELYEVHPNVEYFVGNTLVVFSKVENLD